MNDLKRFCLVGFLVTTVLGILSHFVYDWTGGGFIIGLFFPVNESTWEHMKLMYFPLLAFSVAESKILKEQNPDIENDPKKFDEAYNSIFNEKYFEYYIVLL